MSDPRWYPRQRELAQDVTVREDADGLAHVVSYDRHRFCDGCPTRGVRDLADFPTCVACAAKASVARLARGARG